MARPPVYGNLAERIRQAVLLYADGWEIPSVRSLCRLHNAAPDTIRKALQLLVQQGEIASRGGTLRYVRRRRYDDLVFCKPYPAVALLSYRTLPFGRDSYMCRLLEGLFAGLHQRRLSTTILADPDHSHISLLPGGIATQPADLRFSAVVFVSGAPDPMLEAVAQAGAVAMTLDCLSDVAGVDSVAVDCEAEAHTVVEYLARLGHTHVAFVAPRYAVGPSHWAEGIDPDATRFSAAVLQAKGRFGLNASAAMHYYYSLDAAQSDTSVRLAIDRLWRLDPPPTALICFDPFAASHAGEALRRRGLRCPADVSIIARECVNPGPPSFTTLVSDPHQMGAAAANQLVERLTNVGSMPRKLQFSSALVAGPSTGPSPRAQQLA
jgi:hypothetical protein